MKKIKILLSFVLAMVVGIGAVNQVFGRLFFTYKSSVLNSNFSLYLIW